MKAHYHVLCGMTGGYMPNSNYYAATRKDAEASARELAANARSDEYTCVTGSASSGWYDVGKNEYIEIMKCFEDDCSEEDF